VDALGIQPLFWGGGTMLAAAGMLGLLLLGRHGLRQTFKCAIRFTLQQLAHSCWHSPSPVNGIMNHVTRAT